jgi:hypothetical protein
MSTAPTPTPTGTDSPIANNNPIKPVNRSRLKEFTEKASPYTTILGAVNDIVGLSGVIFSALTIISTILFVQSTTESPTFIFTQNPITGEHMLGLWAITAYAYFGVTRKAYDKTKEEGFNDSYTKYFLTHIAVGFKKPLLSILFGVLIVVFTLVMSAVSEGTKVAITIVTIFLVIGLFVSKYNPDALDAKYRMKRRQEQEKLFSTFLTQHWTTCEKLIAQRLSQQNHISYRNLNDFATVHGLEKDDVEYLLAKYATTYPRRAKFGYLYWHPRNENEKTESRSFASDYEGGTAMPIRVLVSLKYYNEYKHRITFVP